MRPRLGDRSRLDRVPVWARWPLVLPLALLALLAASNEGQPAGLQLIIVSGDRVSASLTIGDDLRVALEGASPGVSYRFTLYDDGGVTIAQAAATANADGVVPITDLWLASGVVGCDPGSGIDPASYRFARFEDAELLLAGRTFGVGATVAGSQESAANSELPLIEGVEPRFFFSDIAGCPRYDLTVEENVYLSGLHLPGTALDLTVFLAEDETSWNEGAGIVDVRGGHQVVPITQVKFTALLWSGPEPGCYGGIVRDTLDPLARVKASDYLLSQGFIYPFASPERDLGDNSYDGLVIRPCPDCETLTCG